MCERSGGLDQTTFYLLRLLSLPLFFRKIQLVV